MSFAGWFVATFGLQENPFCFSNHIFRTGLSALFASDRICASRLHRSVCMSCCGHDVGVGNYVVTLMTQLSNEEAGAC